jgi:hypothetical protein
MTDFDLERLGDVWRQQPNPAELELLRRSADTVRRRARWSQLFDIATAVAVAAMVILLVFSYPQRNTVLMGSAAILFLLYSHIRTRRIRQLELRSLTGATENMLHQSIERLEATLKYNRFLLMAFAPGLAIGLLMAASANISPDTGLVSTIRSSPPLRLLFGPGMLIVVAATIAYVLLGMRRVRREHGRLVAMRESYREERKLSDT